MNLAIDRDIGTGGIADIVCSLPRDVAGRPVGEFGCDNELLDTAPGARIRSAGEDSERL